MKLALFINGYATVGKDEVVKAMTSYLQTQPFPVIGVSSIDPVRNMLRASGYPVDNKTDEMRALMAEVGDACEKFDSTKSKYAASSTNEYLNKHGSGAVFVHVREAEMILKVESMLDPGIYVRKILVTRPGIEAVKSNKADMDVMNTKYDHTVNNDGTLHDLHNKCVDLFGDICLSYS